MKFLLFGSYYHLFLCGLFYVIYFMWVILCVLSFDALDIHFQNSSNKEQYDTTDQQDSTVNDDSRKRSS